MPDVGPEDAIVGLDPAASFDRAPCCQPVPGERIVGIANKGHGVTVHAIDCTRMAEFEDQTDRWIDLRWTPGHHAARNAVTLDMTISNAPGVLGRICLLMAEQNANISDLRFTDRKPDFFRVLIDVEVRDRDHLHGIIMAADIDSDVAQVRRYRAAGRGQGERPAKAGTGHAAGRSARSAQNSADVS